MLGEKPYAWGNAQFDAENHRKWEEFREKEPYVEEQGLVFLPPKPRDSDH